MERLYVAYVLYNTEAEYYFHSGLPHRAGNIGAAEFRDRFIGIFSSPSTLPSGGEIKAAPELPSANPCEVLFKQMAMLITASTKRRQLLALCPDVRFFSSSSALLVHF